MTDQHNLTIEGLANAFQQNTTLRAAMYLRERFSKNVCLSAQIKDVSDINTLGKISVSLITPLADDLTILAEFDAVNDDTAKALAGLEQLDFINISGEIGNIEPNLLRVFNCSFEEIKGYAF